MGPDKILQCGQHLMEELILDIIRAVSKELLIILEIYWLLSHQDILATLCDTMTVINRF